MPNRKGLLAYRLGLEAYYHKNQLAEAAKHFWASYQAGIIEGGIYHLKVQLEKHTKSPLSFEACQTLFHAQREKIQKPFHVDCEWLDQLNEKASLFRESTNQEVYRKKERLKACT